MSTQQQSLDVDQAPDLNEQIAELKRELQKRRQVYPRLIEKGTLRPDVSAHRIRCMNRTLSILQQLLDYPGNLDEVIAE